MLMVNLIFCLSTSICQEVVKKPDTLVNVQKAKVEEMKKKLSKLDSLINKLDTNRIKKK
jgi:hypothetical protein